MTKSQLRHIALSLGIALVAGYLPALCQSAPADKTSPVASSKDKYEKFQEQSVLRSYTLQHTLSQNEANEILIAIRNLVDPSSKIYLIASQNVIDIFAPPEQQQIAQEIVRELDHPKQSFRLIYTVTQNDGGKRVGTQHYSMVVVPSQRMTFKQGSKVPVLVSGPADKSESTQYQYLDVGMNFDSTIDLYGNGLRLRSRIEQSSIADEKSSVGLQDPIVRQTVMEGTTLLTAGKPTVLGSLDVPESTRRVDVEVVAEPIP